MNNLHDVFDEFESLSRHHFAKESVRNHQISQLATIPCSRILDIGIGPGLYLAHWLNLTRRQNTEFVLLDHATASLERCLAIAIQNGDEARVKVKCGDFHNTRRLFKDSRETFDLIFIGNVLEYMPDPSGFLESLKPLLNPNGVIAIRDLDCGMVSCNHVDPELVSNIVRARIAGCKSISSSGTYHNPFIGRNLAKIAVDSGLVPIRFTPYFCEFRSPISDAQKQYLSRLHTSWYVEDPTDLLTTEEKTKWSALFSLNHPDCILSLPTFYYVEAEYLLEAKLP